MIGLEVKPDAYSEGNYARPHIMKPKQQRPQKAPPSEEAVAMGRRIYQLRVKKGYTQTELATAAGITQQNVADYENGRAKNPKFIAKLAPPLGTSIDFLLYGDKGAPPIYAEEMIPFIGVAAAGRWIDPGLLDPPSMIPRVNVAHSRWSEAKQYALRLEGPSLNKDLPDGSTIICTPFDKAKRSPLTGDLVHAVLKRGQLEEWSIKRLKIGAGGLIELWPNSTDPRFQSPFRFDPKLPDDDSSLELRGLVITALQNLDSN